MNPDTIPTKRSGTALVLQNHQGLIFLQLRDNKPSIEFPNYWDLWGGIVEPNETPRQGIHRECLEELEYILEKETFAGVFPLQDSEVFVFCKKDASLTASMVTVKEGQRGEFFSLPEALQLSLAFNTKEILEKVFLSTKHHS